MLLGTDPSRAMASDAGVPARARRPHARDRRGRLPGVHPLLTPLVLNSSRSGSRSGRPCCAASPTSTNASSWAGTCWPRAGTAGREHGRLSRRLQPRRLRRARRARARGRQLPERGGRPARRGVASVYAGPVGEDDGGRTRARLPRRARGGHAPCRRVPGARTAVTEILLEPDGERRFLREDYAILERRADAAEWDWLAGRGRVHSSRMPRPRPPARARRDGRRVSYDFTTEPCPRSSTASTSIRAGRALGGAIPARRRGPRRARRGLRRRDARRARRDRRHGERSGGRGRAGRERRGHLRRRRRVHRRIPRGRLAGAPLRACLAPARATAPLPACTSARSSRRGHPLEACA